MAIHRQLQLNGLKAIDENQAVTRIVQTTYILGVTGNSEVVLDFVRKPVSCPGAKIKWAVCAFIETWTALPERANIDATIYRKTAPDT